MNEEWPKVRLGDMATWRGGMTPSLGNAAYWSGGTVPWISSKEVTGGVLMDTSRKVTQEAVEATSLQLVPAGSVVVVVRSGILQHTLPVAFVPFATTVNQDIKIGQPSERVEGRFLAYLLESRASDILGSLRKTGTTVQSINVPALLDLQLPLPPLLVQRRIADVMEHLDNQINRLRTERVELLRFYAALREHLLTPREGWKAARLGDLLEIARGGSPRPIDEYITDDPDGLNWIKIGDAELGAKYINKTAQRIKPSGASRSRRVYPGDFILSNSMSFGRPYILTIPGCIHDGWLVLADVQEHFDPQYLHALLSSRSVVQQFDSLAAGSGVRNLNIKVVSSVEVQIPEKDEQAATAQSMITVETLIDAAEDETQRLVRVRKDVLNALLTGGIAIPDAYDELMGVAS